MYCFVFIDAVVVFIVSIIIVCLQKGSALVLQITKGKNFFFSIFPYKKFHYVFILKSMYLNFYQQQKC